MNDRPTPETDAQPIHFVRVARMDEIEWLEPYVPAESMRRLERERDEARADLAEETKFHHRTHAELVQTQCQLQDAIRERDEAREVLSKMYNAPTDCPCEVSNEILAIWAEARDILSNVKEAAK